MSKDSVQLRFASQGSGHLVALRADLVDARLGKPRFAAFKRCDPGRFPKAAVDAAGRKPGTVVDADGSPCAVNAYGICIPLSAFIGDLRALCIPLSVLAESDPQGAFDVAAAAVRSARGVPWRFDTPDAWREVASYAVGRR